MNKFIGFTRKVSDFTNDNGAQIHSDKVHLYTVTDEAPEVTGQASSFDAINYEDFNRVSNVPYEKLSTALNSELLIVTRKISNKEVLTRIIFEGK